jgi:hypothetical protein
MMLFIGNATKQKFVFAYRVPEVAGVRQQEIQVGGQVMISGNLSSTDIDAILDQHRPYGLVASSEIDRTKTFAGLCYSIGQPITAAKLGLVIQRNTEVLVQRGQEMRKQAAVMIQGRIENDLAERQGMEGTNLRQLDMSVVEEEPKGGYTTDAPIAEGIRVKRDGRDDRGGGKQSRRARRRQQGSAPTAEGH